MSERDAAGIPDGREAIDAMGWFSLPFGCVGITRNSKVNENTTAWPWLILIPWAKNDAKPWIDGTQILSASLLSEVEQREQVIDHMRSTLDKRYGEAVGRQAAESFIEDLRGES
jgi:hypothetical protein